MSAVADALLFIVGYMLAGAIVLVILTIPIMFLIGLCVAFNIW